jgi:hypothetical protein
MNNCCGEKYGPSIMLEKAFVLLMLMIILVKAELVGGGII